MSDAPAFDQYGSLPGHLQNPAKQVMRFTGYFLDMESQEFRWTSYKEAIDNRPDVEMVIEQYDSNRVVSQEQTVEVMVNKIADCMMKIVSVVIDKEVLAGILLDAYTSLAQKEDSGCACYNKDGSDTAFTYRLLLVGVNQNIPDDFHAVVATIKMGADIQDKESWFGLDKSSSQNFSAEVNSMRLAVTKNFVAGPKPPM
ncbi:unnamed protein product [Rhizoctonia solani]|uniref:Delta-endotoxin CytB n=1 Tax=Rhizoctonia solani TaxID=456999 RepID=A0A8H3CKG0_9AGAM|nr:unnamed protein product [Rhizoctonia solani]